MHFLEVTALVKKELRLKLSQDEELENQESIFTSVYNWFVAAPIDEELSQENNSNNVLEDKDFLKRLRRELKVFEVCIRIFEEECI